MDGYMIWDKIAENSDSAYNLNSGRYGVGRYGTSTTEDPTNQVIMRDVGTTGGDIVRSDFEDGTLQGWQAAWGGSLLSLSNSAEQSYSGSRSLKLALSGSGYPAVYLGSPPDLTPGEAVTYHLYRPSGSPVGAKLFTRDCNWGNHFSGDRSLSSSWNELTFTAPSQCTPLKEVGLQVNNPSGWSGPVYLDRVSWS